MKILNLYAGIGGNRKLWGNEHEITAIEKEQYIADIYKDLFKNDTVIVCDAHQYLLEHFSEYDFIWASPPCPTHSVTNHFLNAQGIVRYPDMKLWQEIILLKHFFKGKYCIENVISYYEAMFNPQESGRHYFWANFKIPKMKFEKQRWKMKEEKKGWENHKDRQEQTTTLNVVLIYPVMIMLIKKSCLIIVSLLKLDWQYLKVL